MTEHETTRMRASDEERERVAAVLRTAMSEGRLTLDEGEERLAGAYAAKYRDELPRFTADLPHDPPPRREPAPGPGARGSGRRGPGPGLVVAVAAALLGVGAVLVGGHIWPAIVLGIVGLMILKHGILRHSRHHYHHSHRWPHQQ
jgi:hypothetical protein